MAIDWVWEIKQAQPLGPTLVFGTFALIHNSKGIKDQVRQEWQLIDEFCEMGQEHEPRETIIRFVYTNVGRSGWAILSRSTITLSGSPRRVRTESTS